RAERFAFGIPAADLGQHGLGVRLLEPALRGVVPGQVEHRPVALVGARRQFLPDPLAEVIHEPQLAARLTGRLDGGVMPLQYPLHWPSSWAWTVSYVLWLPVSRGR